MSKIVRFSGESPPVYIGERHIDRKRDLEALSILSQFFSDVQVETGPDGHKLIPTRELLKIKEDLMREN